MHAFPTVVLLILSFPFALLLAAVALGPVLAPQRWDHARFKALVVVALTLPVAIVLARVSAGELRHALGEYLSFVITLGALFTIAGGVHLAGDLEARPAVTTAFVLAGALLASLIGTTGAALITLRPLLQSLVERRRRAHLVLMHILAAANAGGLLTPLGDPPLLLGYLRGVPFDFTFRLWPLWLVSLAWLGLVTFLWDRREHALESPRALARDNAEVTPLRLEGRRNLPLLAGCALAVLLPTPYREVAMVALALLSVLLTPAGVRERNRFTYAPILEVAVVFAGIFVTLVPAAALLHRIAPALPLGGASSFFLATGVFSSVLDNTPTYLAFVSVGRGLGLTQEILGVPRQILLAISAGAVLMGANTYIGNGPNFMIRAIAELDGVKMYSFARYTALAVTLMAPIYLVAALWFGME